MKTKAVGSWSQITPEMLAEDDLLTAAYKAIMKAENRSKQAIENLKEAVVERNRNVLKYASDDEADARRNLIDAYNRVHDLLYQEDA